MNPCCPVLLQDHAFHRGHTPPLRVWANPNPGTSTTSSGATRRTAQTANVRNVLQSPRSPHGQGPGSLLPFPPALGVGGGQHSANSTHAPARGWADGGTAVMPAGARAKAQGSGGGCQERVLGGRFSRGSNDAGGGRGVLRRRPSFAQHARASGSGGVHTDTHTTGRVSDSKWRLVGRDCARGLQGCNVGLGRSWGSSNAGIFRPCGPRGMAGSSPVVL